MRAKKYVIEKGSFRDPSGFIFYKDGQTYRQINKSYQSDYDLFIKSGLYDELLKQKLIIPHEEIPLNNKPSDNAYKVISVGTIQFISYPYEWCFSQLQDAALTTLKIQQISLRYGMTLKDASAYNIQFFGGKPILIDTLSFEKLDPEKPWIAYKQFCQHFLSPLSLMNYKDIRLSQLLKIYIDGIPLDLTSKLLPKSTWANFFLLSHIHLHAKSQLHYANKQISLKKYKLNKHSILALIDNLESAVKGLRLKKTSTEWGEYYTFTNYTEPAFKHKKQILSRFLKETGPQSVWDLGSNTGEFSRIASNQNIPTVSFDLDPIAVEKNYLTVKSQEEKFILPLLLDLTNPSPGIGWANTERKSLSDRGSTDIVLALAIIHHLAISNNLPFAAMAEYLSQLGKYLVLEFVPKEDSQVQRLLSSREDIFTNYNEESLEKNFGRRYMIIKKERIVESERTMYLMKKRLSQK